MKVCTPLERQKETLKLKPEKSSHAPGGGRIKLDLTHKRFGGQAFLMAAKGGKLSIAQLSCDCWESQRWSA